VTARSLNGVAAMTDRNSAREGLGSGSWRGVRESVSASRVFARPTWTEWALSRHRPRARLDRGRGGIRSEVDDAERFLTEEGG
jgi:hypothetical protein